MNSDNNTVISPAMREQLKKMGLDGGYQEVPDSLQAEAEQILNGRDVADIPEATKNRFRAANAEIDKRERYLAKKEREADGNRRHELALKEARERLLQNSSR